ncbi:MAG: VOC family protein, partial [Candidatus Eremiobacteraeota bacterium]|nr:VOC family protein [Candidatus Eremiobacteraeota bacterium]
MTTTTQTQLRPYVFFYGRCEEALEFYKSVFGGTYEAMRNSDAPAEITAQMPPNSMNNIMHASFTAPGFSFLASDGREEKKIDPEDGNVSLTL